jgi:hypothetical protein
MRPFERRAANAFPYFKLAVWDARNCTWRDGKKAFPTEAEARKAAGKPGKYRVSRVDESGYADVATFSVN